MLASLLVVGGVIGAFVAGSVRRRAAPRPSERDCALLVDRYVEQLMRQRRPEDTTAEIAHARRRAHALAAWADDVHACRRDLTAEEVACGLRAPDLDALERCMP